MCGSCTAENCRQSSFCPPILAKLSKKRIRAACTVHIRHITQSPAHDTQTAETVRNLSWPPINQALTTRIFQHSLHYSTSIHRQQVYVSRLSNYAAAESDCKLVGCSNQIYYRISIPRHLLTTNCAIPAHIVFIIVIVSVYLQGTNTTSPVLYSHRFCAWTEARLSTSMKYTITGRDV